MSSTSSEDDDDSDEHADRQIYTPLSKYINIPSTYYTILTSSRNSESPFIFSLESILYTLFHFIHYLDTFRKEEKKLSSFSVNKTQSSTDLWLSDLWLTDLWLTDLWLTDLWLTTYC